MQLSAATLLQRAWRCCVPRSAPVAAATPVHTPPESRASSPLPSRPTAHVSWRAPVVASASSAASYSSSRSLSEASASGGGCDLVSAEEVDDLARPSHAVHCAYLKDFRVLQHAPRRARAGARDLQYRVGSAWVRFALGDSGAGPSLITASLLGKLPSDAVLRQRPQPSHVTPDLSTADGSPMVVLGEVDIAFHLGGAAFWHTFSVVEGDDLLILGNDFIASHGGSVRPSLSGDGYLQLTHNRSGRVVRAPLASSPSELVAPRAASAVAAARPSAQPQEGGVAMTSVAALRPTSTHSNTHSMLEFEPPAVTMAREASEELKMSTVVA